MTLSAEHSYCMHFKAPASRLFSLRNRCNVLFPKIIGSRKRPQLPFSRIFHIKNCTLRLYRSVSADGEMVMVILFLLLLSCLAPNFRPGIIFPPAPTQAHFSASFTQLFLGISRGCLMWKRKKESSGWPGQGAPKPMLEAPSTTYTIFLQDSLPCNHACARPH